MTTFNNARKSAFAVMALGVVLFSFAGLDSTIAPETLAATAITDTNAQVLV